MANADAPFGLIPVRTLGGGEIRTTHYTVTASQTIYRNSQVIKTNAGTISAYANSASTEQVVVGVAAETILAATAGDKIAVYDDPDTVFKVQLGSAAASASQVFSQTLVGTQADFVVSNSTTTKRSKGYLAASPATTQAQLRITDIAQEVDNAAGANANVEVMYVEHFNARKAYVAASGTLTYAGI